MDGDVMRYNFGALDELAGTIDGRVKAIENLVQDLRNKVNNLAQMYEGASADGFTKTRNDWERAAVDLNQVLARISVAVKQTREDSHTTEQHNTARWNA